MHRNAADLLRSISSVEGTMKPPGEMPLSEGSSFVMATVRENRGECPLSTVDGRSCLDDGGVSLDSSRTARCVDAFLTLPPT